MPRADLTENQVLARKPERPPFPPHHCGAPEPDFKPYPAEYWFPTPQYPYPYPCPPVSSDAGSIEGQIAKLSKKSATIRKMIENLTQKKKSIIISVGAGSNYNFGTYLDSEGEETEYGEAILEILQKELEAIKAKIVELTGDLEVSTDNDTDLSGPVGGGSSSSSSGSSTSGSSTSGGTTSGT